MTHSEDIHQLLATKSSLKQRTHRNTIEVFHRMKKVMESIAKEQHDKIKGVDAYVPVSYQSRSQFEAQIQFSGDVLLLQQHTNTFTFPSDHPIHQNPYVKANSDHAYVGVIRIYNFLADSFKFSRMNDMGYCIGRIFVNAENQFFMDGMRPFSFLFEEYGKKELTDEVIKEILEMAMKGAINDELTVPPFEQEQYISIGAKISQDGNILIATSKRVGFPYNDTTD